MPARVAGYRRRVALALVLVALFSTGALDWLLTRDARARLVGDIETSLTKQAAVAAELLARKPPQRRELPDLARALGARCACRVTVVARDGAVLGDSEVADAALASLENHAKRPEIVSAFEGAPGVSIRYSSTLRADLLYAAVPLRAPDGALRLALPLTEVDRQVAATRGLILSVSLLALLAAGLLSLWVSRALSRPVEELSRLADRLAAGDYAARARLRGGDEHGRLGEALNSLAEKVQETVAALERDRSQLATILDSIVEAVAAVDARGRLIAANPALRALFAAGPAEPGTPFVEVLRHPKLQELAASVLKEGRPREEVIEVLTPQELHFEAHAVPLRDGGALLVLHDITRLRRLETMRREFVANVSHELRTPLASIRAMAETLRDGALDDAEHRGEFVEAIEKDAERLGALVEDLLDLSAIESGRREPRLVPLDALAVARTAAERVAPLAERAGVRLDVQEGALPLARADADQLLQVCLNLLDNAIKFNKSGGKVSVAAGSNSGAVWLEFSDTGVGIPAEDLPRVFERFYRVDKSRERAAGGGTGLGLAIAKHIVEAHHGRLSARSRVGEGSVFRVELPL